MKSYPGNGAVKFLLPALLFVVLFSFMAAPSSAWWDESWDYRKEINITSLTGNLTDYQVAINVTHESGMNSSFSDIRFTYLNETSSEEAEISYWIENKTDASWAYSWVRVPFIKNETYGNSTIYLYYGNSAASSNSNASDTMDFYENWESGTIDNEKWDVGGDSGWNINETYVHEGNYSSSSGDIGNDEVSWIRTNITVQMRSILSFDWKVYSEKNYDYLYYCLNQSGCSKDTDYESRISGDIGWKSENFTNLSAGMNTIKWAYGKDVLSDSGFDRGFLDYIKVRKYSIPKPDISKGSETIGNKTPNLYNTNVTPESGGWGREFEYSVDIEDVENDTVNVTLLVNMSEGWRTFKTKTTGTPGNLTWNVSEFNHSDIGQVNYKFEFRDLSHSWKNTTAYVGPRLEKNNITITHLRGNNTSVQRSGTDNVTLGVRVWDIVRESWVSNESIDFWANNSDGWEYIGSNESKSGNATLNFDPGCSIDLGRNKWKANYSGGHYYNETSETFNFTAEGQLVNNLLNPRGNYYSEGDQISIEVNLTDSCGNPVSDAEVNFTINETYECEPTYSGNGLYNCAWNSTGKPLGNYSLEVNSTTDGYLGNSTSWEGAFIIRIPPPQIDLSLLEDKVPQTEDVEINASVYDPLGSEIERVWINVTRPDGTVDTKNMTNITSGLWNIHYPGDWGDSSEKGVYNITVYAENNRSEVGQEDADFKVYTNVNITFITPDGKYYQGRDASVSIQVKNLTTALEGMDINLSVKDPDGNELYIFQGNSYTTDSEGRIYATFIIPSDAKTGNYTAAANYTYNFTELGDVKNKTATKTFEVVGDSGLSAELSMPNIQYVDEKLSLSSLFYEHQSELVDPDDINITLYYSTGLGLVEWFSITQKNMTKESKGFYTYSRGIGSDAETGNYIAVLSATRDSTEMADINSFQILKSGPFDVSVEALKSEVEPGEDLPFRINITNTGPTDRFDVNVSYWVDDADRYSGKTSVRVPSNSYKTLNKEFDIFSDQGEDTYTLHTRVVYDPEFAPATAETTFRVSSEEPSGGGPSAPTGAVTEPEHTLEIVNIFPSELAIERPSSRYVVIEVKNTGNRAIHDISAYYKDKTDWSDPVRKISSLEPGSSGYVLTKFNIPDSAESKTYVGKLKVLSKETEIERNYRIQVFESRNKLLRSRIENLRGRVSELEGEAASMGSRGSDVTESVRLIERANDMINIAESYLENGKEIECGETLDDASNILREASYRLSAAEPEESEEEITIPWSRFRPYLILSLFAVFIIIVSVLVLRKKTGSDGEQEYEGKLEVSGYLEDWMERNFKIGFSASQIKSSLESNGFDPKLVDIYLKKRKKGKGKKKETQSMPPQKDFYLVPEKKTSENEEEEKKELSEEDREMLREIKKEYEKGEISEETYKELKKNYSS